ncbi:putative metal-binding protein [Pyrobaculum oguniense TE7]|uniref:Metal-binding protein n=1 Tax=Pyrobaculum oguniense (strain DSM 13380 / JCM 10595 / TE7) TaxID=698757 RepID=H6Q9I8_PYROT|nr:putative metal-binding protein [Pyrobaculum oguniense TE7]
MAQRRYRVKKAGYRKYVFLVATVVIAILAVVVAISALELIGIKGGVANYTATKALFYYSPPCSCCDTYLPKLKSLLDVVIKAVSPDEFLTLKRDMGIPESLQSCHTIVIGGKYIEGHVPISAVAVFVNGGFGEDVKGLALPHRETNPNTWEGPGYYIVFKNGTIWRVYS